MRKPSSSLLLIFLLSACFFVWACQKGITWGNEIAISTPETGSTTSGCSGTLNDTAFTACIDTAYYETSSSIKTLQVTVTDSAGNSTLIALISPSGSFAAGTYGSASGNGTIIITRAGNNAYTVSGANTSFSFVATIINDSIIAGTFSATLANSSNQLLKIGDGKINAFIGKANTCSKNTGNGNGSANDSAVYDLTRSGTSCSIVNVQGTYTSGTTLNNTNQAQVEVNVTKTGKYSMTSPATNGMTFSASGAFTTTGKQNIILQATGTPLTTANTAIPVSTGTSNCSFTVKVL